MRSLAVPGVRLPLKLKKIYLNWKDDTILLKCSNSDEPATTCDSKLSSFSFNSGLDRIMSNRFSFKCVQNHSLFLGSEGTIIFIEMINCFKLIYTLIDFGVSNRKHYVRALCFEIWWANSTTLQCLFCRRPTSKWPEKSIWKKLKTPLAAQWHWQLNTWACQNFDFLRMYLAALMYSRLTLSASCFRCVSNLVTQTMSASSAMPFFKPCSSSPLPGGNRRIMQSTMFSMMCSAWPTPKQIY